jgi:type VI secretion system protein ImpL
MLSFFKARIVLEILGIILLSVFIWFAGFYFAFADFHPLAAEWVRLGAIALLVVIWAAIKIAKIVKASSASAKLASAVASQPDPAPSSDEAQLRERFEEAIAALKTSRGRDHSLYSEPWYVIIGAPGSGKSTLLQNSGLQFPLAQRFGKDAVRGVGGTRNCDWWFTDDAIFLDTAGRFTTQDSDPGSDARAWKEFLALLKKYRSRRPLNGVILTVSVADLLTLTAPGRDAQVAAARRRLDELNRELRIRLPIYLLVTKCDLMSGFTEYFDDLTPEERKQVWGVTFPYELTMSGKAPELFGDEFDQLVARLNERMWQRLENEREAHRRAKIFSFPQQLAALKDVLNQFVTQVFAGTRMDSRALLRGVHLTSGTQEGTPIDRLLGSVGRAFAFEPQEVPHAAIGRGKAYFVERLLKEVILPESGLAGVNRRLELQIAGAQLVTYVGLALITVLVVTALTVSYSENSDYLAGVRNALAKVAPNELRPDASMDQIAARLDQVRDVVTAADRYAGGAPWSMRWGLYAGGSMAQSAQEAYKHLLNGLLLPKIAALFRQRLETYAREPAKLYEYLKAYLMLGDKGPLDKTQLKLMTGLEWNDAYASNPPLAEDLKRHSDRLFDADSVRPTPVDDNAVEQARSTIHTATLPALMYGELKMSYAGDAEHALRLDNAAGLDLNQVLARRSGRSWSTPMPGFYTKAGFSQVTSRGMPELVIEFAREGWVVGESTAALALRTPQLTSQVLGLYEKDYIAAWDQVVNDLQLPPLNGMEQMKGLLATITSKGSPLRGLLKTIDENTYLVKPDDAAASAGVMSKIQQVGEAGLSRVSKLLGKDAPKAGPKPGTQVTEHFAPIHDLVAGAPGQAHIDAVLDKIAEVAKGVSGCGAGLGEKSTEECVKKDPSAVKALSQEAKTLPAGVGPLVETIATTVDRAGVHEFARDLVERYQQDVQRDCEAVVGSRYPFNPASQEDVPIADFGHVFGYGGLFDKFYKDHLADVVDTRTRPWRWKVSESGAVPGPEAMLHRFEVVESIRKLYFRPGTDVPEFRFSLAPAALDSEATRVELNFDGQVVEYRHGPIRATPVKWPGPANGTAGIIFEERGGGHPNLSYTEPWAWFRLIDKGQPQAEPGARYRYRLSYAVGSHTAVFTLEAESLFNPLERNDLQRFACRF